MNTIKWELEDLAFATLYPKRYDEIVRLGRERAAEPRHLPARRRRAGRPSSLRDAKIKRDRDRAAEALLLDLPEDDRPRPRLRRHLRPRRAARPGRDGPRLLRRPRHDPRELAAGSGPVQGLHRDAQVQHVPVAAHDGDRSGGQAGRAADPHARDAPPRRVRHRRALEVQGRQQGHRCTARPRQRSRALPPTRWCWLRQILDWQRETSDPGEFLDSLRFDLQAAEVFVFTPKGDVVSPAGREPRPVDFAYAVHTEVGHRCIGARVNGRLVPLESPLDNGDVVEIFTLEVARPPARAATG